MKRMKAKLSKLTQIRPWIKNLEGISEDLAPLADGLKTIFIVNENVEASLREISVCEQLFYSSLYAHNKKLKPL